MAFVFSLVTLSLSDLGDKKQRLSIAVCHFWQTCELFVKTER